MKKRFQILAAFVALSSVAFASDPASTAILGNEDGAISASKVNITGALNLVTPDQGGILTGAKVMSDGTVINNIDAYSVADNVNSTENMAGYHHGGGGDAEKQFRIGGQLEYSHFFGGAPGFFGIGVNAEFATPMFSYRFNFTYHIPSTTTVTVQDEATAINPFNPPNGIYQVPVTETDKTSVGFISLGLDVKRVFGDDKVNSGVYVFAGLGIAILSETVSQSFSSYDQANYELGTTGSSGSASLSQLYINLGLGYGAKVGPGYFFGEASFDIAANEENGMQVDVQIPSYLNIRVGYDISLLK